MQIINKSVGEIKPYKRNPRKNDQAVDAVAASIKEFGFKVPIIIDKDGEVVAGHTRLKAAKKLGLTEVPCIIADDLTPDQIKAFRLADNKTAELAEWDFDLLEIELGGINLDMTQFGFDLTEGLEDKPIVEDEPPVVDEEEAITKPGDIYKLGKHRLICGDSTDPKVIAKLMQGKQADLCVTDPPYNVDYEGGTDEKLKIKNDNMESSQFKEFLTAAFRNIADTLRGGAAFYVWFASREHINFEQALNDVQLKVREELIWVKNALVLGRQDYQWKHEPCLYGWKDGTHYFTDDRTQTTVQEDRLDLKKLKKEEMLKLLEEIFSDKVPTTVIHENKPLRNDDHPTMKPLALLARLIRNSSKRGEIVCDFFGGSGSTLMACQQTDRVCYMCELDEHYCDVIVKRWENFTGQKAERVND